jgi:hypothetical protein
VKFLKTDKETLHFHMAEKEKALLFQILDLYPLIPGAHQKLSRTEDRPEDQKLLETALAEQRGQNKKELLAMMKGKSRFRRSGQGWDFSIPVGQVEWLLQVLNDVRVGSWLALGSPEEPQKVFALLNKQTAPHFWAMEIAGHFQGVMLEALRAE